MSFDFSIHLTTPQTLFDKRVMTDIARELNAHLRKNISKIKKTVGPMIAEAVRASNEVQSILHGNLSAELGFVSPPTIEKQIYDAIKKSVQIEFTPFKYNGTILVGDFRIVAIHDDFSDIIATVPNATYQSNGHNIDWLKWLLFDGNNIIVAEYQITYNPFKVTKSRSRRAIMEPDTRSSYRIPAKWSGTQFDNFITRSIDSDLERNIKSVVEKVLS